MRVLVTGAAGFIGFHTARRLLERGDQVLGYDNFNRYYDAALKERRHELLAAFPGYQGLRGDLGDRDRLAQAFDWLGSDAEARVCHLAAQAGVRHSIENPDKFIHDNIHGFHHVIEACRHRSVPGLIYASTSSVYGNNRDPLLSESSDTDAQASLYGVTKKSNELQARAYHHLYGLRSTGLRFFTVYGPWGRPDMALFLFTDAVLAGRPIRVFGHGRMKRDFTYIDDNTSGVVAAIDRNHPCEIINLGGGKSEELMDFIATIERTLGREAKKEFLPMQLGDVERTAADLGRARELLGYQPTTRIEQGVPRFVEWFRSYYGR